MAIKGIRTNYVILDEVFEFTTGLLFAAKPLDLTGYHRQRPIKKGKFRDF